MSPTIITSARPLDSHPQRPWRSVQAEPRRPATVIRAFAAPVVRELPPRRELRTAGGSAW